MDQIRRQPDWNGVHGWASSPDSVSVADTGWQG
jgi:hypothetical protein